METINIINNLDSNIITENILITNQYKLIQSCIKIFQYGYLAKDNLTVEEAKEFINKQKFINWNMFIDLINLDFKIYKPNTKIKLDTLEYLIETKTTNLVEFLLNMDLNLEQNIINWVSNNNIFLLIFKNFYSNDIIISKTIDLIKKYKWENEFELGNKIYSKTILSYAISKCSENIIIKMLEQNLIPIDWNDTYSNNIIHWTCKRNMCQLFNYILEKKTTTNLLNQQNKGGRTPIHIACIKNNFYLTKSLEKANIKMIADSDNKTHINYAIKYGNEELVMYLLNLYAETDLHLGTLFYDIIQYQNEKVVEYFIDNNFVDIEETNFIWTLWTFGYTGNYSQMLKYGQKKIIITLFDYFNNLYKYYDGKYIGDIYEYEYDYDNKNFD